MSLGVSFLDGRLVVAGNSLLSSLERATCPSCDQPNCVNSCDGAQGADDNNEESESDAIDRQRYNAGLDAVESLLLAYLCAGPLTQLESRKLDVALQTCVDAWQYNSFD